MGLISSESSEKYQRRATYSDGNELENLCKLFPLLSKIWLRNGTKVFKIKEV
jgi:hypothetical protein